MSRELTTLLVQKIDEMKRLPVMMQPAAARCVVELAVSIITDHENRLANLERNMDGEGSKDRAGDGAGQPELPGLQHVGADALGEVEQGLR